MLCNSTSDVQMIKVVCQVYQYIFPKSAVRKFADRPHVIYFANSSMRPFFPPRLLHKHEDRLEINYVTQGRGTYVIDNYPYPVEKGDLLVINSGQTHDEIADPHTGLNVYCCGISGLQLPGLKPNQLFPPAVLPIMHLSHCEPYIASIYQCMEQFIHQERAASAEVCCSLLTALIGLVRQLYVPSDVPIVDDRSFDAIQRVKLYIDGHYSDDISIDHVAESLNMSVSYMAHSFKNLIGYSPGQYIIRRRIGEAQTLLSLTDSSITQISSLVGYDNSNYFSTIFSKMVRLSPKQYRQYCVDTGHSDIDTTPELFTPKGTLAPKK